MTQLSARTLMIAASAALLLMGTAASAQTTPPQRTSPSATAPAAPTIRPVQNPLTGEDLSKVKGTAVYGSDDKKIGSISTVLMQPSSKTVDRLVVGAGGLLGMGSHDVALPLDQFTWDSEKGAFKIGMDLAAVKAMPAWGEASASSAGATGTTGTMGGAGRTTVPPAPAPKPAN